MLPKMNVRYALAFLTLLVVIAMPFIVFQVNQQQQLSPSKRRTLEQQLARMKTVQETQQKVIETLREELRHTKAADVAKEELHETKADTQGKDINAKQDAESCVDSNENCPGWVDCCPNGTGEGSQCGDTDCSRPGDAPCEGLWMRGACKLTCGICPGMVPVHAGKTFEKKEPVLAPWEREPAQSRNVSINPPAMWEMFHEKNPRVVRMTEIITEEEAAEMRRLAEPHLRRSQVVDPHNSSELVDKVRTSQGMWMHGPKFECAGRRKIIDTVSEVVGYPPSHFEQMQILRYHPGEYYIHHSDYFESHMLKYVGAGNRVATSIVFLNNLHEGEGGGTKLVYAKPEPVLVTPKTGTGILFYNVKRNQMVDRSSEHEAIPPKEGFEKWVAILWIRLRPWS
ncbi:putative prolyl 4-hydroxylase 7 [Diplonema papillatum]|nr:putative prolyl 4-hydroxylase 7 [Diplonema papillatum]